MRTSLVLVARVCLLLLLLPFTGCGGGPKLIPVAGQATFKGVPIKSGTVTYYPDDSKGNNQKFPQPPLGNIEDGKFVLATGNNPGVPPGHYKVTIHATTPSNPKDEYSEPKLLVEESYTSPTTTTLAVEVKAGAATGSYDIKLDK